MKRFGIIFLVLIWLLAALLTGCANTNGSNTEAVPTEAPMATEQPQAPESPVPEDESTPEDPIPACAEQYAFENYRHPLLDNPDILVEVVFARALSSETVTGFLVQNRTDRPVSVTVSDIVLNGEIQVFDSPTFYLNAHQSEKRFFLSAMTTACAMVGFKNITELTASVGIREEGSLDTRTVPCSIAFPEGIVLRYAYEAFHDMRADRQVLHEDDTVTVALLGCGAFYASTGPRDILNGILWIENHGSKEIPVHLSNVSVNGKTVYCIALGSDSLNPGESCLIEFSVYGSELDTAGITSVSSLALQLLTSEEENSGGAWTLEGGTWYPVALSESGMAEETTENGRIVYQDGLLEIGLNRIEFEPRNEYTEVRYIVYVANHRTEGISLHVVDPLCDDLPYQSSLAGFEKIYPKNNQFGPESEGFMTLTLYLPKGITEETLPTLSLCLQVRSQGNDSIFYTTAERIILAEE